MCALFYRILYALGTYKPSFERLAKLIRMGERLASARAEPRTRPAASLCTAIINKVQT
jgi:hypothetical protein